MIQIHISIYIIQIKNIKIYLNSNNIINNLLTRNNNNKLKKNSLKFTVHQKQKIELKKLKIKN